MSRKIDLLVLGGGPAGYSSAIRARQLGKSVVLVEQNTLGGTCLNRGCIPTKTFLESANFYYGLKSAGHHGVSLDVTKFDFQQVLDKKNSIVGNLVSGLEFLLKRREIEILRGEAKFNSNTEIQICGETFNPSRIIVATGTKAGELPGFKVDGQLVLNSDHILDVSSLPQSLLIVGGGVIGCEFATVFSSYGVDVTIVELTNQLLPYEDSDVSRVLTRAFKKRKVQVLTNASIEELTKVANGILAQVNHKGRPKEIQADQVLISVGRKPQVPEGFSGQVDEKGYVVVNEWLQTSIPHIYAAGDVIGGLQLAHLAFEEGWLACNHAFGEQAHLLGFVPSCVYTQPEIGSIGLTEREATQQYGEVIVAKYSLKGNGRAVIAGDDSGFCKIVASPDGIVRGVHIIGPQATELISNAAVALQRGLTLADWAQVIYPHPTVSEAIKEAILSGLGQGLHTL